MSEILPRPDREKIPDKSETNFEQELTVPTPEQQEVEIGPDEAQILSQIKAGRSAGNPPRDTLESISEAPKQEEKADASEIVPGFDERQLALASNDVEAIRQLIDSVPRRSEQLSDEIGTFLHGLNRVVDQANPREAGLRQTQEINEKANGALRSQLARLESVNQELARYGGSFTNHLSERLLAVSHETNRDRQQQLMSGLNQEVNTARSRILQLTEELRQVSESIPRIASGVAREFRTVQHRIQERLGRDYVDRDSAVVQGERYAMNLERNGQSRRMGDIAQTARNVMGELSGRLNQIQSPRGQSIEKTSQTMETSLGQENAANHESDLTEINSMLPPQDEAIISADSTVGVPPPEIPNSVQNEIIPPHEGSGSEKSTAEFEQAAATLPENKQSGRTEAPLLDAVETYEDGENSDPQDTNPTANPEISEAGRDIKARVSPAEETVDEQDLETVAQEEIQDRTVENATVSEKELNFRAELLESFPELNNEKGEAVQEALVAILRHEKVNVGEIKTLFRDGFRFMGEADMPEGWQQTNAAGKREKMFANTNIDKRNDVYTIDLYEDLFKPEHASSRTAILAHELGEMIHVRAVARADENEVVRREPVVDLEAYKQLVAGRKLEWSDPYIRREQGKKHFFDEMISDDIGDYLNSESPQGMLRERLHRFPSRERTFLEAALDSYLMGSASEDEAQAIQPMLEEAETIYAYIDEQWKTKKDLMQPIKKRGVIEATEEEEELESYYMPQMEPSLPQSNMKTDTRIVDNWIDFFMYAGQKAA